MKNNKLTHFFSFFMVAFYLLNVRMVWAMQLGLQGSALTTLDLPELVLDEDLCNEPLSMQVEKLIDQYGLAHPDADFQSDSKLQRIASTHHSPVWLTLSPEVTDFDQSSNNELLALNDTVAFEDDFCCELGGVGLCAIGGMPPAGGVGGGMPLWALGFLGGIPALFLIGGNGNGAVVTPPPTPPPTPPEPIEEIPEPMTLLGTGLAVGFGRLFAKARAKKRQK